MNILVPVLIAGMIGYGVFMLHYAFKHPETASTRPEDIPLQGIVINPPTSATVLLPQIARQKKPMVSKTAGKSKKSSRKAKKTAKK